MDQETIERAWVLSFRADLMRQLADLKLDHDNAEENVAAMKRQLDRLHGAIDGIDALLRHVDQPAVAPAVVAADNGWPIGG